MLAALLEFDSDLFGDGLDLLGIRARADDKEVSEGGDVAQIEHADVESLFGFGGAYCGEPRRGRERWCDGLKCERALFSNSLTESPYPYGTLKLPMRQLPFLLLCLGGLASFGQTPADSSESIADKRIELARRELTRISDLVGMGALPRQRLDQAQQDFADAQDDAVLARTLYGEMPVKDLTDQLAAEMVAAAERRVERQQARIEQARKLIEAGFTAQQALTPLESELSLRETSLNLARERARLMNDLAELAKLEESIAASKDAAPSEGADLLTESMEHFEGNGIFLESRDLKPIEEAFAKKFDHPLPISAEGETSLHRALGFDHRGRVDVALDPNGVEGMWLRTYLKASLIPYYAFTHAVPGKATAAHIHIGPGSTRLSAAD
jgi:hypothetical protein